MGVFSDVRFWIRGIVQPTERLPMLLIHEKLTPVLQAVEREVDDLTLRASYTVIERQTLIRQ